MNAAPPTINLPAPCLCGHVLHVGRPCDQPGCRCSRASPDYVAHAVTHGLVVTDELRAYTEAMKVAFGWRPPGALPIVCIYCEGTFYALRRRDAKTCSGACRIAVHRALQHETDADVPSPALRRECYAADRAAATGFGLMTTPDQYAADLRVRKQARQE
jgi:hypothetical protein